MPGQTIHHWWDLWGAGPADLREAVHNRGLWRAPCKRKRIPWIHQNPSTPAAKLVGKYWVSWELKKSWEISRKCLGHTSKNPFWIKSWEKILGNLDPLVACRPFTPEGRGRARCPPWMPWRSKLQNSCFVQRTMWFDDLFFLGVFNLSCFPLVDLFICLLSFCFSTCFAIHLFVANPFKTFPIIQFLQTFPGRLRHRAIFCSLPGVNA